VRQGEGPAPRRRGFSRTRLADNAAGWLFIAPAVILIGVFGIFPAFFTVYVSLFKWRLKKGPFVGLANYAELLGGNLLVIAAVLAGIGGLILAGWLIGRRHRRRGTVCLAGGIVIAILTAASLVASVPALVAQGDRGVFDSLRVTIWYSVGTVPMQLAAGVVLAVLLNRKLAGRQAFRLVYLLPYVAPTVATAAVFDTLFSLRPDSFANEVLALFGRPPQDWLQEAAGIFSLLFRVPTTVPETGGVLGAYWLPWAQGPSLSLVAIMIYSWWVFIGYYALIYLNGLSAIPRQLYEAAEVDGAGRLRSFFAITLPLLSPTTYFLSLLGVIGTFKAFTHLFVLRSAAAQGTTDAVSITIFFTFYQKARLAYASAISMLLFLIVLGLTVLQNRIGERRVTYGD
jgi:multiple sugar transport system permease protein